MTELKPCPFCGKQPHSYWQSGGEAEDCGYWAVECCHTFVHLDDEPEAIAAWNTRNQPTEAPASEWAMEVWCAACGEFEDAADLTLSKRENTIAGDQAAARIIEQAFAEREAAADAEVARRGVEAAAKVCNQQGVHWRDSATEDQVTCCRSAEVLTMFALEAEILALIETQENG